MKLLARKLAKNLQTRNGGVVLLSGVMGAGKTTLVSEIIRNINPNIRTTSPTFAIINQYAENIYHADLYRLEGRGVEDIGLYDLIEDKSNYIFIEWAGDLEVAGAIRVNIEVKEGEQREFVVD